VAAEVVANEAGDELQMLIGKGVRQEKREESTSSA
jgi:hypothetical protein